MSKIVRTEKPSVLPLYAAAAAGLALCAVLPVYQIWALAAALGRCPSTPAAGMWMRCSPASRNSWTPCAP